MPKRTEPRRTPEGDAEGRSGDTVSDGQRSAPGGGAVPRPGDLLANRYELTVEIGRGGMGRVFCAHDRVLGRDVAVKVLTVAGAGDDDFRRACAREARAAARLVHHGIVTVFDVGTHDGQSFLVMELAPGSSLRELLDDRGTLPIDRAVDVAERIADALAYAHRNGVLHRDVKPHNIIVAPDGGAKLVDFGIAQAANTTGTIKSDELYGSIPYLAPEQVRGEAGDARADVYALGVVLYEMLVGRPPFEGGTPGAVLARRLTVDPPPPRSIDPSIPPELERVVLSADRRESADRDPDADTFRDALRGLRRGAVAETVSIDLTELRGRPATPLGKEALGSRGDRPGSARAEPTRTVADAAPFELTRAPAARPRAASGSRSEVARSRQPWPAARASFQARPRLALALAGLFGLLAIGLLLAATLGRGGGEGTTGAGAAKGTTKPGELPGIGWATFTKASCEWSNPITPPAICFGERPPGFRVRVLDPSGRRWLVWDPETTNVAYVDPDALRRE